MNQPAEEALREENLPVPTISAARPSASGITATKSTAEQLSHSVPLRPLRHLIQKAGKRLLLLADGRGEGGRAENRHPETPIVSPSKVSLYNENSHLDSKEGALYHMPYRDV